MSVQDTSEAQGERALAIWERACVGREGYCSSDLQDAAVEAINQAFREAEAAARAASLPAHYQWSEGNREKFDFGRDSAADAIAALSLAPGATAQDGVGDGQDRKFAFRDGQYVNRISGEPIPHDEPIIIFRARDHHSIHVLREYLTMVTDEHHRQAIRDRMAEFSDYAAAHPERMKEPGITHDIRHNEPTPTIPAGMVAEITAKADQCDRLAEVARSPACFEYRAKSQAYREVIAMFAAAPKQAEQQGVERMRAALQEIADMPDNLVPTITVQGMRNVAGFALIGGHHAG